MGSKIHIAIIVANLPAERDRRVIRECLSLEAAGFSVTVIAPRGDRSLTTLPGSRDTRLRPYPVKVHGSGIFTFAIEFCWSFLCIAFRLLGEVLAGRAHAVQVCNPPDVYFPLAILVRALGRPWIFDHHDLSPELYAARPGGSPRRFVYRALELLEWLSMRTASWVLSSNQSLRDVALTRGVNPRRVTVVRDGPTNGEIEVGHNVPDDGLQRIVYLGVLGPQDNVGGALLAAEELGRLRGRAGWRLVIAGDGAEMGNLRSTVEQRQLGDVVEFVGWLGPQGVDQLLRQAACAIQPDLATRLNQLSSMAKTVEYLARGVPVVAVDLLETRRTAADAAIYVQTGDPAEFARAMDLVLRDQALREKMRAVGLLRFQTLLAWEKQAEAYLDVWRRLLAERLGRAVVLPMADADGRERASKLSPKVAHRPARAKNLAIEFAEGFGSVFDITGQATMSRRHNASSRGAERIESSLAAAYSQPVGTVSDSPSGHSADSRSVNR